MRFDSQRLRVCNKAILLSPKRLSVFNPYTDECIAELPCITTQGLEQVFLDAFNYNPALSREQRYEILTKASKIIEENSDFISDLITRESGLSKKDTIYEVSRVQDVLNTSAIYTLMDDGQMFSCDITKNRQNRKIFTQREPLIGVISAITPFNHPMNQIAHKIAPAIATNNRIVIKPSEKTPLSALLFADIMYEAGLPEPMLQVVVGNPVELSDTLIGNQYVDLITFTGSVLVGKLISQKSNYKRLILELGGNDPFIVMDDAEINDAALMASLGSYKNSGQRCTAIKRILVHDTIAEMFVEELLKYTANWTYGDPNLLSNNTGTVIDSDAAKHIEHAWLSP